MGKFWQFLQPAYRHAVKAEAEGRYMDAARAYVLCGERDKVAEMHLLEAERRGAPASAVRELHVAGDDLIAVGAAQKAWILADVSPLRQAGPDLDSAAAYLLEQVIATAERGGTVDYYFREAPKTEVTIEVRNAQRRVVRSFNSATGAERLTKHAGLNRLVWILRGDDGSPIAAGKYEVMLIGADTIMKRTLTVQ